MKVIQVPMDEKLLRAVNREARASHSSRAALIRTARQDYLRRIDEQDLERRYMAGYRRKPEKAGWGQVGAKLAAKVLPEEHWE